MIRNEVAKLYGHIFFNDERSVGFVKNVVVNLNHEEFKDVINYERILYCILTLDDSFAKDRISGALTL